MDFSTLDLDHTPIIAPPPGVVPNFENPKSLAPIGRITIAVVLPLMVIFVVLRFYTRFQISRSIGADDCRNPQNNSGWDSKYISIVFVIFKRIAIFSWASLTHYVKTLLSKESDTTIIGTELKDPKSPLVSLKRLPGIPQAAITGLRTLVRGNPRGHHMDLSELSTYNEINSVNEEYHVQLMGVQNRDSTSMPLSSESELPRPACARSVDSRSK
ncbi:hypothetical protein Daesc_002140 [Daldinia eschscholtzii]|uniref:Uncharacterized protein n=1 Tax=Daldinia eschscholtzii TaxID=292717 RepID=A0AAX6MW68_9PEZI